MFGMIERSRLLLFERTLAHAIEDASSAATEYASALAIAIASWDRTVLDGADQTVAGVVDSVPSALWRQLDSQLLQRSGYYAQAGNIPAHHAFCIFNGLVFGRIVEISRPGLGNRAHRWRIGALSFAEPLFARPQRLFSRTWASRNWLAKPSTTELR